MNQWLGGFGGFGFGQPIQPTPTGDRAIAFIRHELETRTERPLIVGIQGCQGSGKSRLASEVQMRFQVAAHQGLPSETVYRVASVSLDDFYHTAETLGKIATENAGNPLLAGRGLPGTHDLPLMFDTLRKVRDINAHYDARQGVRNRTKCEVELPIFDKSAHHGQGDRRPRGNHVSAPLDVLILEGWCVGFQPLPEMELQLRYMDAAAKVAVPAPTPARHRAGGPMKPFFSAIALDHLILGNSCLRAYAERIWPFIDVMIQLEPVELNFIWEWRLQANIATRFSIY